MRLAGEDGIALVIGYRYGARNAPELRSLFTKGVTLVAATGAAMACVSWLASDLLRGSSSATIRRFRR